MFLFSGRKAATAGAAFALAALSGCAHRADNSRFPEEAGWVNARILRVGDDLPAPLRPEDDCRTVASPGTHVLVGFWSRGNLRRRIVPWPAGGSPATPGEWLHINLRDCTLPAQRTQGRAP